MHIYYERFFPKGLIFATPCKAFCKTFFAKPIRNAASVALPLLVLHLALLLEEALP